MSANKYIGEGAFQYLTGLKSLKFEENSSIEYIGYEAFAGDQNLTSFTFPETSGQSIELGANLFAGYDEDGEFMCSSITALHLSNGVTDLGYSLRSCTTIETITVEAENSHYDAD